LVNLADEGEQCADAQRGGKESRAAAGGGGSGSRRSLALVGRMAAAFTNKRERYGGQKSDEADSKLREAVQIGPIVGEEKDEPGGKEGRPKEGEQPIS